MAGKYDIKLTSKGLRICHWNIRSLNNDKFEQIKLILYDPETQLDILMLTETWLNWTHSDSEYNIPGYRLERKDRQGKTGGGVLAYISDKLTYMREQNYESNEIELLCLKVLPYKSNLYIFYTK